MKKYYIGIFDGHYDPSVAVVADGEVIAYAEEERFVRIKHAFGQYPENALRFCLAEANISPEDVHKIVLNWNLDAFDSGFMRRFYADLNKEFDVDIRTKSWQETMLSRFNTKSISKHHAVNWKRIFGKEFIPEIMSLPHHQTHAYHSFLQSGFDKALCITIDGSGDQHTTVLWSCDTSGVKPLREIMIPHSIGWFYAAITEYLGFKAYDGEYKVMGLAAYGEYDQEIHERLSRVIFSSDDNVEYRCDPSFIHYGEHSWSGRFTDKLVELLGRNPRHPLDEIEDFHINLAFCAQNIVEDHITRLVEWGMDKLDTTNLCVGGGVGLNVKLNSRLFKAKGVDDIFVQPLCSDGGSAVGAALAGCFIETGCRPGRLRSLSLGNEHGSDEIEKILNVCKIKYRKIDDVPKYVSKRLAEGCVVGWFQGRMEAGPRALGNRSILADPRSIESRDKVNSVIKYREIWRPFCPSMKSTSANDYLKRYTDARFMVIAFEAKDQLKIDAPAIVHTDGTVRVQLVHEDENPLFYNLLSKFEEETGVPVLLNTSFNVKGEPVVCKPLDAIRTFYSTGMDVLSLGDYIIEKRWN